MSGLFTLTICRKKLSFKPDGTETTTLIQERHHSVPGLLVRTWRALFPGAVINVTEEPVDVERVRRNAELEDHEGYDPAPRERRERRKAPEPLIVGSSYADAINASLGK